MNFPSDNKQKDARDHEPSRQFRRGCSSSRHTGGESPLSRPEAVHGICAVSALNNLFAVKNAKHVCGDSEKPNENIQHCQASLHKMQEVECQKSGGYDSSHS